MIGDGMGFAQVKAYRYFADDPATPEVDLLPFEPFLVGAVATETIGPDLNPYAITESASSASAYATGQDTAHLHLGMLPDGEVQANITEKATRQGKAVGVVATVEVSHATPAAFLAHNENRYNDAAIADQLFDLQWKGKPLASVLMGGGLAALQRKDRDLVAEFTAAGYVVVRNRSELLANRNPRVLGLFADHGMKKYWDKDPGTPSLAEMTTAALGALAQNPEGFFLLVEGSQIDWAAHEMDVAGVVSEMQSFTEAVERVLEFAGGRGDTLVIITADHETGGLSLGINDIYAWNPLPLRGMKNTPEAMAVQFLSSDEALSEIVARSVSFSLTPEEVATLDAVERVPLPPPELGVDGLDAYRSISKILDQRTLTAWSTVGHTGVDVPLYATGPGSANFHGVLQNEELGQKLQEVFLSP